MTDQNLDLRFASLPPIEPPDAVVRTTLRAVAMERARARWGRVAMVTTPLAALAAAALLAVRLGAPAAAGPEDAPASMQMRGVGDAFVDLDVKAAVRVDGRTERLSQGSSYPAGTTLMFRVAASEAMDLTLRRDGRTLWSGHVAAGESDLPVGYTLEAGESAATFSLAGDRITREIQVGAVR